LVLRMLAAESEIILHKIQTGRLSDEEMATLIAKGAGRLSKAKIYFDDTNTVNIRHLKAKARRLKKKENIGLIVIDYLQLMSGDSTKGNREQEISSISRELKNLAVELDVPIIALSQLSREGVKNSTFEVAPPVSALRESGAIEQDADLILMLWGANEAELANDASLEGKRKLRIAKQRNGVLVTVELDFKSEIQLFDSIKTYF
jgi:replicative DNA helicase